MKLEENVPLRTLTTFRVGGPARFFVRAGTLEELTEAVLFSRDKGLPLLLIGEGSNILADDDGCEGVVVRMELRGRAVQGDILTAFAGERWDDVVAHAVRSGLWGIENLSGIPGTAGAAPVQNIGAYGTSLADTLVSLTALDLKAMQTQTFTREECGFSYRTSIFKRDPGRFAVLSITLALSGTPQPQLSYKDLRDLFPGNKPSLAQVRDAVLAIRAAKFPDLGVEGTAGSFFLNPIISREDAEKLAARFPELPRFPEREGVKIPIAWILDRVLSLKGERRGGVRMFERQPLVIVNDGTASARDIRAFAKGIQERVRQEIGIAIFPEVCILRSCSMGRELT